MGNNQLSDLVTYKNYRFFFQILLVLLLSQGHLQWDAPEVLPRLSLLPHHLLLPVRFYPRVTLSGGCKKQVYIN